MAHGDNPIRRDVRPHSATTGASGPYPQDWWFSLDGDGWIPVTRKPCRIDIEELVLLWEAPLPRTSRAYLEAAFPRTIRFHS